MASSENALVLVAAMISERQDARDVPLHYQKMVALGELASGITHDFRNLLQTVISTLEILESRSNDPIEVHRLAASALRASERGIGLTSRLLKFSRCEASVARSVCLLSSLDDVTETLARTVEARMNVKGEQRSSVLWQVVIDPVEFELALINLGLNARDAMPEGGCIQIGARNVTIPHVDRRTCYQSAGHFQADRRGPRLALPGGDYVVVRVVDSGIGMNETTLARAIEPFFTTKPVGKGTGLGLSAVHKLATQAQGALRLMTEMGNGTTAELWLPRAPALADRPSTTRDATPQAPKRDE
jgi:signal transduction histidine kinase